jgi:hypothetical protein
MYIKSKEKLHIFSIKGKGHKRDNCLKQFVKGKKIESTFQFEYNIIVKISYLEIKY